MPNSLLTIIFIVWLIVPGMFLKRFYFQGYFTKQFGSGDFADRIITSVFWGILIQIITFSIFSKVRGIQYTDIRSQVEATYSAFVDNKMPDVSQIDLYLLLFYIFTSLFIAISAGTLAHKVVRLFKLDTRYLVLRFSNQWHYYLMGDIASLSGYTTNDKKGTVISTQADVILKDGKDKPKLFQGFVKDYFISTKTGELESIIITQAKRWCKEEERFKDIPGDALLIPYANIMDMNFTYNVKVVDHAKRKKRIDLINNILFTVGAGFCFIFPFTLDLSAIRAMSGMVFMLLTLIFLIGFIELQFSPPKGATAQLSDNQPDASPDTQTKPKGRTIGETLFGIGLIIAMTLLSMWALKLDFNLFDKFSKYTGVPFP